MLVNFPIFRYSGNSQKLNSLKGRHSSFDSGPIMPKPQSKIALNTFYYAPLFKGGDAQDVAAEVKVNQEQAALEAQNLYKRLTGTAEFENIGFKPNSKLTNGIYYKELADTTATYLGPDNFSLLVKEKGAAPELLVEDFVKLLKENRYAGLDLVAANTDVYWIDPKNFPNIKTSLSQAEVLDLKLNNLSKENSLRKKIVFVNDYDDILKYYATGKNIEDLFKKSTFEHLYPNVQLVGIVSEELMKKDDNPMAIRMPNQFDPDKLKFVRKAELKGLNPKQMVEFIDKNPKLLQPVLSKYNMMNIDIEPQAVKKIVEKVSYYYDGAFPQKFYDVLDIVAADTAQSSQVVWPERKRITISQKVVDEFFQTKPQRLDYLKFDNKGFTFLDNVKTKFSDIGGVKSAKEELQELVEYAKDPERYVKENPWIKSPDGALLIGPPGTGKTELARAVAGEAGVPFSSMSANEFFDMYIGNSEKIIRDWVASLYKAAEDSGKNVAIGFIDEIDALGKARGSQGDDLRSQILNQLLTSIDGVGSKNSKIKLVFLAATNRADILDKALTRGGRFGHQIPVLPTKDASEALEILNIQFKNFPFENQAKRAEILGKISEDLIGVTGADILKASKIAGRALVKKAEKILTYEDLNAVVSQLKQETVKIGRTVIKGYA